MAYIDAYDVIVTRDKIYIDRYTSILCQEDYDAETDTDVIIIRRLGNGLTEDDFELDFTHYTGVLDVESSAADIRIAKERAMYVIFTDFKLTLINREIEDEKLDSTVVDYSKLPVAKLNEEMLKASDDGDFIKAVMLRDLIAEKQRAKEKKHYKL